VAVRRKSGLSAPARRSVRAPSASTGVTFAQVRELALKLPAVEDGTSYGTPALKVRGKLMARQHQTLDCLVLRSDFLDREILMQSAPEAFFITDHYRDYPWVLMRYSAVQARALPDLLERAWRRVAPKSLLTQYPAGP
jgi:hypothetical protein